ncbi:MYG1 family protein [Synoicihabitans lomoniglobus]|uniref:MYG1 family protein n=1 Tax=Synoicihabitans lomoniglobus TaxID=2909285 RepID=A0AAE9ZY22_9BACT|nr:MYG1 family protein [Opitutaceae bacterium LMO-M01]WED65095.1 MYG1 family protein [Opitutaceae bacterium LMO-M01]
MSPFTTILTHPGGAHKDEFLACCVLVASASTPVPIVRREPTDADLADASIVVVDVGHVHDPALLNFDHHQLPDDAAPTCALSLVLQHLRLYEDARAFCDWLEPAEWFDCRGPNATARWLGVERDIVNQLYSPIDGTMLRRFAGQTEHAAGEPIWELMRMVGRDLLDYLRGLRTRLDFIGQHAQRWTLDGVTNGDVPAEVLFLPRTDPLPDEPSSGLDRYVMEQDLNDCVVAIIAPDRRGAGYGLSRHRDHPAMDFTRITDEADVHFAHLRGFVAKTSATDPARLRELLTIAATP